MRPAAPASWRPRSAWRRRRACTSTCAGRRRRRRSSSRWRSPVPAARATAPPLVCVVAGAPATGPATSVDLESFRHAIAKLRDAYDLVVLLGPPLEAGRGPLDAVALEADALVAAVPPGELEGRAGRELRAALHKLPIEARGAIVVGDA